MNEATWVTAPARLHLGLFSVGDHSSYRFGGAGLMLESPATVVGVSAAPRLELAGASSRWLENVLQRWFEARGSLLAAEFGWSRLADVGLSVVLASHAPRHRGWGSGTQLSLALLTAVEHHLGWPAASPVDLARCSGRGRRSAIGTHGFFRGGFLVDRGKRQQEPLASLELRQDFPEAWRIVTWRPEAAPGLAGQQESQAFSRLSPTTASQRQFAIDLVKQRMVPALTAGDFETFAAAVFELGQHSGRLFAASQGGVYGSAAAEHWVRRVRELGFAGVGQSSWGPTLFALADSPAAAQRLAEALRREPAPPLSVQIHRANNVGAQKSRGAKPDPTASGAAH